jgi:hypothetical protein
VEQVPLADFHSHVVRDSFPNGLSEQDSLLLFTVLHCYQFELAGSVISGTPAIAARTRLSAETQRGCGDLVAELWPAEVPQSNYMHWYRLWNEWGSYSRFAELTCSERSRMRWLISELEKHPFVARLVPEDFDPASDPQ